jgi:hypothetical protein
MDYHNQTIQRRTLCYISKRLIEPCVLAGCPEKVCVQCSEPYKLKVDIKRIPNQLSPKILDTPSKCHLSIKDLINKTMRVSNGCQTETKGGTVLDPFGGSGTTGIVAASHNSNAILLELNAEYIELAKARINKEVGMMATIKHIKEVNP